MSSSKFFLLKNTFKVTLQHLLNVFVLFNTVSFIEINLKLKIDPKMFTFKNLEEIWKTWKNFRKNEWQPCYKESVQILVSLAELLLHNFCSFCKITKIYNQDKKHRFEASFFINIAKVKLCKKYVLAFLIYRTNIYF